MAGAARYASADVGATPSRAARAAPGAVVVSEDPEFRSLLRGLLRLHRHPVVAEAASLDGLEDRSTEGRGPVLVYAPSADVGAAIGALERLLARRPDFRTIVILGSADESHARRALAAGAIAVLPRPFTLVELGRALAPFGASPATPSRAGALPGDSEA